MKYAPRLLWEVSDSPLAVVFHRHTIGPTGGVSTPRYWNYEIGGWSAVFDPAKHARPLAQPFGLLNRASQAFAVPSDLAVDPTVSATLYAVKEDGSLGGVWRSVDSADLAVRATGSAVATP